MVAGGEFVYIALLPTKRASCSIHSTTENPSSCSHHLSRQQATIITYIHTINYRTPSKATTHDKMVYSVVACPLGRLSVQELSSFSYLHDLPRLQFDDGDLVIKLGHHVSEWLIIHSKVFAAVSSRSPLFPVVWGMDPEEAADTITHPDTGQRVVVRVLAIKAVGDGFMLDGKNVVLENGDHITLPYHKSSLAGEGWSVSGEVRSSSRSPTHIAEAARALRVLFTLAYGAELSWTQITSEIYPTRILAEVCAYAETWGCFEVVRPAIEKALMEDEGPFAQLWRDVAIDPTEHAILAKKLKIPKLYYDAIRHMAGQAYALDRQLGSTNNTGGNWAAIAEVMGLEEVEVRNIFPWQLDSLTAGRDIIAGDAKLEGKGWYEWRKPYFAMFTGSSVVSYPTFMAVPSRLPREADAREKRVNPWADLKGEVSTKDASDEWMQLLAELLGSG
jgi:hypothetical protein